VIRFQLDGAPAGGQPASVEPRSPAKEKKSTGKTSEAALLSLDLTPDQRLIFEGLLGVGTPLHNSDAQIRAQEFLGAVTAMAGISLQMLGTQIFQRLKKTKPFEPELDNKRTVVDVFTEARQATEWLESGKKNGLELLVRRASCGSQLGKAIISRLVQRSVGDKAPTLGLTDIERFATTCHPRLSAQADALLALFDLAHSEKQPELGEVFEALRPFDKVFTPRERNTIIEGLKKASEHPSGIFHSPERAAYLMEILDPRAALPARG
jgi:hypothetical protein